MGFAVLLSCAGSSQDGDDHEDDRGDDEGRPCDGRQGTADPSEDEARATGEDAVEHGVEVAREDRLEDLDDERADGEERQDGEQHREDTERDEQGHEDHTPFRVFNRMERFHCGSVF